MKLNIPIPENRVFALSMCLFGIFPLLPEKAKGFPVIFFLLISLIYFFKKKEKCFDFPAFIKLSSLYLINILSIFYTASFFFPASKLETTLSLLLVPFSFCLIGCKGLSFFKREAFFKIYILSTGVLSICSFYYYYLNDLFLNESFKVNSFRHLITKIPYLNDHPIYVSIFLGTSVLLSYGYFKLCSKTEKIFLVAITLINIFHVVLLSSKGVIIGIILATISYVLTTNKNNMLKIFLIGATLFISILGIFTFPNLERRFRELGIKTTYAELRLQNSSSIRLAIYECAMEKIKKRPLLGYGWGRGTEALMDCYKTKSTYLYNREYNSHNQFLGYYLDGGIIAFFVLLFFMFDQFRIALLRKDGVFTSTLIIFTTVMLTENILNRQSGIIVFIFLISFFRFTNEKVNKGAILG